MIEKHSLLSQSIDVGRLIDFRPVSADCLKGMIIRKDKEYIRPVLLLAAASLYQEQYANA